jgi:hypothetical protein
MTANSPSPSPVRIWRCPQGEEHFVSILSGSIYGIFVHHVKGQTRARGRSRPCLGNECRPDFHKLDKQWVGFVPAELWVQAERVWRPIVLQVTEHMEQEFRGVLQRGQEWALNGFAQQGKQNIAIRAVLAREVDLAGLPEAWDCRPQLKNLYHCDQLPLSVGNPLPARLILSPSKREGPEVLRGMDTQSERVGTIQEAIERREAQKARLFERNGKASTNGGAK